jgi:hypothetical protein
MGGSGKSMHPRRWARWLLVSGARMAVMGAAMSLVGLVSLQATTAPAGKKISWPADVFAVGTFNGTPGNVTTTEDVARIQEAVNEAEVWADHHSCDGAPCDTYVLLAPGDYKTVAGAIEAAPPGQDPAGVLIDTANVWLVGMNRNRVVIDGTQSGPPCSAAQSDQAFGPSGSPGEGLNGVMVWQAAGTWVENLTVCNFLDGSGGDGGAGNEIWWNGGAGSGQVFQDNLGGYQGQYLTATSTYFPEENPTTGVSTDLAAESTAATYGIFSSDWGCSTPSCQAGLWDQTYASNFNDSGYYIGACQDECNQTVDNAWAEYNALGYSGSNSGGYLLVEHSQFDDNEDGFDTNSQNGDNPPPQNGACPPGVTPPIPQSESCWVFYDNEVHDNNDPDVPTYGSAAAGPVGTGMSLSGARHDTVIDNQFWNNDAWGNILVPYPDSGDPCTGGTLVAPDSPRTPASGQLCWYDEYGDAVVDNTYWDNGSYGNPTNGDIGATNLEPGPADCFSGNHDVHGLTTSPPEAELLYPTCNGRTVPPDANVAFTAEVACDSGNIELAALPSPLPSIDGDTLCLPSVHGVPPNYPRQTEVVMHPLPGAKPGSWNGQPVPALENPSSTTLPSMPDLCGSLLASGMGANPWCPSG